MGAGERKWMYTTDCVNFILQNYRHMKKLVALLLVTMLLTLQIRSESVLRWQFVVGTGDKALSECSEFEG